MYWIKKKKIIARKRSRKRSLQRVRSKIESFIRMCTGVEEERIADQEVQKLLVERVRSRVVYRSRDCRRVIRVIYNL